MAVENCSTFSVSANTADESRLLIAFRRLPAAARDELVRGAELQSFNYGPGTLPAAGKSKADGDRHG